MASNTIKDYNNYKKNYLYIFNDIQYQKVTSFDWQEFILNLSNKKSQYVAYGCFRLLRAAYQYSYKYKIISENLFKNVETVKILKKKHNHFDLEEIIKMLEICKNKVPEFYVLFFTFIGTGMREGGVIWII